MAKGYRHASPCGISGGRSDDCCFCHDLHQQAVLLQRAGVHQQGKTTEHPTGPSAEFEQDTGLDIRHGEENLQSAVERRQQRDRIPADRLLPIFQPRRLYRPEKGCCCRKQSGSAVGHDARQRQATGGHFCQAETLRNQRVGAPQGQKEPAHHLTRYPARHHRRTGAPEESKRTVTALPHRIQHLTGGHDLLRCRRHHDRHQ